MKNGPDFENRFKKTILRQGTADRVPLGDNSVHRDVKKAFLKGKKQGLEGEVKFWVTAGYDFVPIAAGIGQFVPGPAFKGVISNESPAARVTTSNYSKFTDEDTERIWMEEAKGSISNLTDFEKFNWPTLEDIDISLYDKVGELLPEGMKIIAAVGDIITPLYQLTGFEVFYTAIYEQPELLEKMFERIGNIEYDVFQKVIKNKHVGAAFIGDDVAYTENLMVSPKILRKYLFPWYKEMTDLAKREEKPCIFHSDGKLYEVMDDLIDCGFSALHPIEPKAMDINFVKETWGDRLCIIGNIDLAYTLTLGTPQDVEEEVKQRIHDLAPGGGYCVASSNSITEYVPLENYQALVNSTLKYGTYPISI